MNQDKPPSSDSFAIQHPNIPLWMAMIQEIQSDHCGDEMILDYGCGEGQFLRLLNQVRPFRKGLGVDIDEAALERGRSILQSSEPLKFGHPDQLEEQANAFDQIFIQEVFWMIEDLPKLAKLLHQVIRDQGECLATMGCHTGNPLWSHRRKWLAEQGFQPFDYSLDDVAGIFYEAGFEVGLKRLVVNEFTTFHPKHTPTLASSLEEQVHATADHKMLFQFRRDDEWRTQGRNESIGRIN